MFDKASQKLGLSRALLSSGDRGSSKKKAATIDRLLRLGAYQVMLGKTGDAAQEENGNDDDEESRRFCEKDIDMILSQDSRVIRYNDEFDDSSAHSTIGKATFASDEAGLGVSLDDPQFWEKMLPHFNPIARLEGLLRRNDTDADTLMTQLNEVVQGHITAMLDGAQVMLASYYKVVPLEITLNLNF
jgi:hypothetical protein